VPYEELTWEKVFDDGDGTRPVCAVALGEAVTRRRHNVGEADHCLDVPEDALASQAAKIPIFGMTSRDASQKVVVVPYNGDTVLAKIRRRAYCFRIEVAVDDDYVAVEQPGRVPRDVSFSEIHNIMPSLMKFSCRDIPAVTSVDGLERKPTNSH
jgi:hypothetical protein